MEDKFLLEAKNITKQFPGVIALQNVDFKLKLGEVHALLGENGAGKSTLIKVITGVYQFDDGYTFLEGNSFKARTPQHAQDLGISTVYQEVNLCSNLSVAENIFIGRDFDKENKKNIFKLINWKNINNKSKDILKQLDIDIDVTKSLDQFPVAIQQMVAIARAININAKVLILDEPTSSLNQIEVENLFKIIRLLKNKGLGIIFVTHFLDQVYEISDKITILRNGSLVGEYKTCELNKIDLIGKMIGKVYDELYIDKNIYTESKKEKEILLSLKNVTNYKMPNPLNVNIEKNQVLGFAGLLGSGRTELSRIIFGIDKITSGIIKLKEKEVMINNPITAIRYNIGYCPEDRKTEGIIQDLTIKENIIVALQAKQGIFKFITKKQSEQIANKYIKLLNIKTPSSDQLIKNLSGGNQQKVMLARWLATNPELLILDEPTRGIDIGTKAEIQKLVVNLSYDGMSVIFISSEIDEMIRSCSRIIVLDNKKKICELTDNQINENIIMNRIAGGDEIENAK